MENRKILIWIVIGVLLVGGASYLLWPRGENLAEVPETESVQETDLPTEVVSSEGLPAEGNATEIAGESGTTPEATVEVESLPPTPRQELESTNPDTVSLASGGPQLVEVFAFW